MGRGAAPLPRAARHRRINAGGRGWVLLLNANYGRFAERASRLRERVLELLAER